MKTKLRLNNKLFQNLAKIFLFIVSLAILANLVIDNHYTHKLIQGYIKKTISEQTRFDITFTGISISAIPFRLETYGLKIIDKSNNTTIIDTTRVSTGVSLSDLFIGKFKISNLKLENSIIDLNSLEQSWEHLKSKSQKNDKNRSNNLAGGASPFLKSIEFENLVFKNGQKYFSTQHYQTNFQSLNVKLYLKQWNKISGFFFLKDFAVQSNNFSILENGSLKVVINYKGDKVKIKSLQLQSSRLNLKSKNIELSIANSKIKEIAWDGTVSGDLSTLGSFLDFKETYGFISGSTDGKISIPANGSRPKIDINCKISAQNAVLYGFRLLDTEANLAIDSRSLTFSDIIIKEKSKILAHASGQLNFSNQTLYNFDIEPKNLPLSSLLKIVKVNFKAFDGTLTKGIINLSGSSTPFSMKVNGPTNLNSIRLPVIPVFKSVAKLNFPDCDIDLSLAIDEKSVSYSSTKGECYQNSSDTSKSDNLAAGTNRSFSQLSLKGDSGFDNHMDLVVDLETKNLSDFSKFIGTKIGGAGKIKTSIYGKYDDLKIKIEPSLQNTQVFSTDLGKLTGILKIDTKTNTLKIEKLKSSLTDENSIIGNDSLIDFEHSKAQFKFLGENIPANQTQQIINAIDDQHHNTYADFKRIKGQLKIDFTSFDNSKFFFDADASNIVYKKQKLSESARGKIRFDRQGLWSQNLIIDPTGSMEGQASIKIINENLNPKIGNLVHEKNKITLIFDSFNKKRHPLARSSQATKKFKKDASQLIKLPYFGEMFERYGISGHLSVNAKIAGTFNALEGVIQTESKALNVFDNPISPVNSKIFINDKKIEVSFNQVGATLIGNVVLDFSTTSPRYTAQANFSNFDLKFLFPSIMSADPRNYLYVDGKLDSEGPIEQLSQGNSTLSISNISAKILGKPGANKNQIFARLMSPVTIKKKDFRLYTLNNEDIKLTHSYGNATISLKNTKLPDGLNIKSILVMNLTSLKDFFEEIEESKGTLVLESDLTGNLIDPKLTLKVTTLNKSKFSLGLASLRPAFKEAFVDLKYSDGIFEVLNAKAKKGSGRIEAKGQLNFSSSTKDTISISINKADINYDLPIIHTTESTLSGDIEITGKEFPLMVNGEIIIDKARSNKNIDLRNEILSSFQSKEIIVQNEKINPLFKFDIDVISKDTIRVENKTLKLTMGKKLKIEGNENTAMITGNITIASGKIKYKKDYSITRGFINFDDKEQIDPTLDISAFAEIENRKVTVEILGRSSKPKILFSVDPPTRDDGTLITQLDTLILMATGKVPEAQSADSPGSTLKFEAANAFLVFFDDIFENIINPTTQTLIEPIYLDAYPSEDGSLLLRANAPVNTGNNMDLLIQGDSEKVGVKAAYDLEETISTSINYSKDISGEATSRSEDNENVDASVDLRFRFLFP